MRTWLCLAIGISSCGPAASSVSGSAAGANGGAWFGVAPGGSPSGRDDLANGGAVHVHRRTERYQLSGRTASDLAADLRARLPDDEGFTGWTKWRMSWRFEPQIVGRHCEVGPALVQVTVTTVLPSWSPPADAQPGLPEAWDRYLSALELHEEEHAQLAEDAAERIQRGLHDLPASLSCASLQAEGDALAARAIEDLRSQNANLDLITSHGATEGAVFPAPP